MGNPVDPTENPINTIRTPISSINKIIGGFLALCVLLAGLSLFRQIRYENLYDIALLVWNGGVAQHCFNATVVTSEYPSLLKRFELESYTKLAFRFALMFPATSRIFHAYIRLKFFEYKTLNGNLFGDGIILGVIYKVTPVLLFIQTIFCAATLILNGFEDNKVLPGVVYKFMLGTVCSSLLYMACVVILDFRESNKSPLTYVKTARYMIRFIGFVFFVTCAFPTYVNFVNYVNQRQCNFYATTAIGAWMEYIAITGISIFHFSELFDLSPCHFFVFEIA